MGQEIIVGLLTGVISGIVSGFLVYHITTKKNTSANYTNIGRIFC